MYKDLNLSFRMHPVTKDLSTVTDNAAIKQSLKNLILTKTYERVDESIGTNVKQSLFKLSSVLDIHTLKSDIIELIENYESRVKVENVSVRTTESEVHILIKFTTLQNPEVDSLEIPLEAIR